MSHRNIFQQISAIYQEVVLFTSGECFIEVMTRLLERASLDILRNLIFLLKLIDIGVINEGVLIEQTIFLLRLSL